MKYNVSAMLFICILNTSCLKEPINSAPQIIAYSVSSSHILPGDTVAVEVDAMDEDNDNLTYEWAHKYGLFLSDSSTNTILWKVPYIEGGNSLDVQIRDEHVTVSNEIVLPVEAYVADDFSGEQTNRLLENASVVYSEETATVTQTDEKSDCIFLAEPDKPVYPPYSFYIELNTNPYIPLFTSSDKYGAYIDLWNVGADTLIKAIWFRVYPFSSIYTWKLSVLQDQGASNAWVDVASNLTSAGNTVSKLTGVVNKLKITVLENSVIQLYCNNSLLDEITTRPAQFGNDSLDSRQSAIGWNEEFCWQYYGR